MSQTNQYSGVLNPILTLVFHKTAKFAGKIRQIDIRSQGLYTQRMVLTQELTFQPKSSAF